tara:strand:+ start:7591 stop:8481 length:891 start_codon:yes stop_codon:yes gene_type:complete
MNMENHSINLPIGSENNLNVKEKTMGRLIIGNSIRETLINSNLSLGEISENIEISENTIRRWTNGAFKTIRKNNLNALAELFDKDIAFENNIVEFRDKGLLQETIELDKETNVMGIATEDLIKQKDRHISLLEENLKDAKERVKSLKEEKAELDLLVKALTNKPDINLDNNRMQFVVDMHNQTFVNCTQLYADLYDADAFAVIKEYTWVDVCHKDDLWRLQVIMSIEGESERGNARTWKLKPKKNGKAHYVETVSIVLDSEGRFKKVDAKLSTKEKWEQDNEYYRSLDSKTIKVHN